MQLRLDETAEARGRIPRPWGQEVGPGVMGIPSGAGGAKKPAWTAHGGGPTPSSSTGATTAKAKKKAENKALQKAAFNF
jgi:hypothetical protein